MSAAPIRTARVLAAARSAGGARFCRLRCSGGRDAPLDDRCRPGGARPRRAALVGLPARFVLLCLGFAGSGRRSVSSRPANWAVGVVALLVAAILLAALADARAAAPMPGPSGRCVFAADGRAHATTRRRCGGRDSTRPSPLQDAKPAREIDLERRPTLQALARRCGRRLERGDSARERLTALEAERQRIEEEHAETSRCGGEDSQRPPSGTGHAMVTPTSPSGLIRRRTRASPRSRRRCPSRIRLRTGNAADARLRSRTRRIVRRTSSAYQRRARGSSSRRQSGNPRIVWRPGRRPSRRAFVVIAGTFGGGGRRLDVLPPRRSPWSPTHVLALAQTLVIGAGPALAPPPVDHHRAPDRSLLSDALAARRAPPWMYAPSDRAGRLAGSRALPWLQERSRLRAYMTGT